MALPTNTGSVSDAQNNPLGLVNAETADFQPTRSEQPQMLQALQAHPPRTRRKQVCRYFGSKSGNSLGRCPT
ncbi:hypothetical protein LTR16_004060 [Cryomyces antarcticus]|uniref:Uncharacterized protein n=1 Tax=Cryomyces antarcticus TaxID=329879 RepID=A0ABR0KSB6_9PEZI|nr:hypothetical protein LTR60_000430 [Cryomyces antarcticus]KAK5122521.1 hypothetical protein LTR16_004060 [Cryomyces antarcticus]